MRSERNNSQTRGNLTAKEQEKETLGIPEVLILPGFFDRQADRQSDRQRGRKRQSFEGGR